jgi:ribosome modulation factor
MSHCVSASLIRGAEDYRAGLTRGDCPFSKNPDRALWLRGWDMQRALCPGAKS